MRDSVDSVNQGAKTLLESFGLAFSVREISAFVDKMAEAGEQIIRTAAMLGASTTETQQFGYIAKMTGGDTTSMAQAMERFQVSLARAQNPTSQQAAALRAFGLSAKELIGLPLPEQMNRFADAVSKFADGPAKTAAIGALNRGFVQMIPVLDEGREGLERMRAQAEDTGAVLSGETVTALANLDHNLVALKASTTALGATLVGSFAGGLAAAASSITAFIANFTFAIDAGKFWQRELEDIKWAVASLALSIAHTAQIASDFFHLDFSAVAADWERAEAEQADLLRQYYYKLGIIALEGKFALQKQLNAAPDSGKPQVPTIDVNAKSTISAQLEAIQTQIKLYDEAYNQTKGVLENEAKLHQIIYDQETQMLLAALDRRHTEEIDALDAELQIGGLSAAQYQKIVDEKLLKDQEYAAAHEKIIQTAAQKDTQEWENALKPLESAFNSQLRGLLAGTETWGQAMKKIAGDLVIAFIEAMEKIALQWAATQLAMAVGGPATMFASAAKAITTNVGVVYSGEAANLALTLGPAAPGVAAGIASTVQATALGLSALDVGAYDIPSVMPALLHPGEMVLPQTFASGLRGALGGGGDDDGGGGDMHFHFDGPIIGTQAWINSMIPQLTRAMQSYQNLNPSTV